LLLACQRPIATPFRPFPPPPPLWEPFSPPCTAFCPLAVQRAPISIFVFFLPPLGASFFLRHGSFDQGKKNTVHPVKFFRSPPPLERLPPHDLTDGNRRALFVLSFFSQDLGPSSFHFFFFLPGPPEVVFSAFRRLRLTADLSSSHGFALDCCNPHFLADIAFRRSGQQLLPLFPLLHRSSPLRQTLF